MARDAVVHERQPLAKNPTKRLSGHQKGSDAPSVPSTGLASSPASERSHSWTWLPVAAVKASHLPSAEDFRRRIRAPCREEETMRRLPSATILYAAHTCVCLAFGASAELIAKAAPALADASIRVRRS